MIRIERRYVILALLGLMFGAAAYFGRGVWAFDAFAANIAAGFIGALATVALIDRSAERRAQANRQRVERVAMAQARLPLLHLTELLYDMMKAATAEPPAISPADYDALFVPSHTDAIDWLKLDAPAGVLGGQSWYLTIETTANRVSNQLSAVIDKYAAFVSVDFIELVESVRDDAFLHLARQLNSARSSMLQAHIKQEFALNGTKEVRDAFFPKLRRLLTCYRELTGKPLEPPAGLGRNDVAPKFGSARLARLPTPMRVEGKLPTIQGNDSHWLT